MDFEDKIIGLLGFASKSRNFVFGKEGLRSYIRSGQDPKVVIVAKDAGETIKKELKNKCNSFKVPIIIFKNKGKAELSKAIGKTDVSSLGIEDKNIVKGILELVKAGGDV